MTRVNLVPVDQLSDQHLFAEWRELKMVPRSLARSLAARGQDGVLRRVPPVFCLGHGHVTFFYNKGAFLRERFAALTAELEERGVHRFDRGGLLDSTAVYAALPAVFHQGYQPTPAALALSQARIALRLSQRPGWYRYRGSVMLHP